MKIYRRTRTLVNTDPQRRCYDGCHFSSELVWGPWESFDSSILPENAERTLKFWRDLNDYAVRERGEGARCEFKFDWRPPIVCAILGYGRCGHHKP